MKEEQSYKEEIITIIMPSQASSSHIFNDEKYEVINTSDENKEKIVLLRIKNSNTK
jgi:hypothetical protein